MQTYIKHYHHIRCGNITKTMSFSCTCIRTNLNQYYAIYIAEHGSNSSTSHSETYQEFLYNTLGMKIENFEGELDIPVFLDNSCTISIIPKIYYEQHKILQ